MKEALKEFFGVPSEGELVLVLIGLGALFACGGDAAVVRCLLR